MKTQISKNSVANWGPFLKLVLTLAEQREKLNKEEAASESATAPLPAAAINAVMEKVVIDPKQPVCARPVTPGPFLTMFLTVMERKSARQSSWLVGSIVPAGTR